MFKCENCNEFNMYYDYGLKKYICKLCGHEIKVKKIRKICFNCGTMYNYYTWFDPSSCCKCNCSFVE